MRALKNLHSTNGNESTSSPGNSGSSHAPLIFSIGAYTLRVQALIADVHALLEKLVWLAQTHDMLKKNTEHAEARAVW